MIAGTPDLSVVIPTFNNLPVLKRCLESWKAFGFTSGYAIEVIVIEDGCRDETPAYLKELEGRDHGNSVYRWFHEDDVHELRCCNRGMSEATAPLILLWQDDMFVRTPWFVGELIRSFKSYPELGLLSLSRGLNCLPFPEPITVWEDLHHPARLRSEVGTKGLNWLRLAEVDIVIRPWAVRRACIEKVGKLDEAFVPTEWDEADLCFRLREAGWKVATHSYERLGAYQHLGSTTLNFSDGYKQKVLRNGLLFHSRWDKTIRQNHPRVRRAWMRQASLGGWLGTVGRVVYLGLGSLWAGGKAAE